MGGGSWEDASSAAFRRECRQDFTVLTVVIRPITPRTMVTHMPKPNFACSQEASSRKKHRGNMMEKPNCVTQSSRFRIFIEPPGKMDILCPFVEFCIIIS